MADTEGLCHFSCPHAAVDVRDTPCGLSLFASRPIPRGSPIFSESPLALIQSPETEHMLACAQCLRPLGSLAANLGMTSLHGLPLLPVEDRGDGVCADGLSLRCVPGVQLPLCSCAVAVPHVVDNFHSQPRPTSVKLS